MTRTKAPNARIVPHIRGKPVTWLTPLPPNRGPTEAGERNAALLQMEAQGFNLKRGTNLAVWQSIVRRGREPTEAAIGPIRSVSRGNQDLYGKIEYRTDYRIRGPNLYTDVLTDMYRRTVRMNGRCFKRPRCQGETRARDIETKSFICGTRCPGREGDAAG